MRNATLSVVLLMPLAAMAGNNAPAPTTLTARQVIARIQEHVGVPWQTRTVDTFKAGNPDTPVTGIAVTFSATVDVLRRAAASGKNLIITHEPTFYNHLDTTADLKGDPVFAEKQALIEKHGLVVWRFHDHWHRRRPDGILEGMAAALGWEKFRTRNANVFAFPATTLGQLASAIRERLKIRTLRVIGNPEARIATAALLPGAGGARSQIGTLAREDVDVVLIGESSEWETPEYARDAAALGKRKGLVVLGHVPSEEAGMEYCARWLRGFVTEVPVEFIAAGEPFWTPR
jgi:putative NIF3 family GTP cyclohydrolase 1 type 2